MAKNPSKKTKKKPIVAGLEQPEINDPDQKLSARTLSLKELSALLMVSDRRIQQLTKDGIFRKTARGFYPLEGAIQSYIRFLKDSSAGNASQVNIAEYHIQKTRKIKAEAEIVEMEAAQMAGELVAVVDVKHSWANLASEVCIRMRNVPTRVIPMILGDTDERRMKDILLNEIDQALSAIANDDQSR